jgi:hypothetical protein
MEKARTILLGLKLVCVTALLLVPLFLTCPAHAQFTFTTNADGSLNISNFTGFANTLIIPDTTNGIPITSIGLDAFFIASVTNVVMGTNMANIGADAFTGCYGLASVTMPNGITNIGQGCFSGCRNLTNINIPTNLTSIAYETFEDCASLTSITLPKSVTYIGGLAFWGCTSLTNVTMLGVTNIDGQAFQGSGLTTLIIPNSVTSIGALAFNGCHSLASITIPESVTSIGQSAFYGCISLRTVTIPDGVTSLQNNTFFNCTNLTSVTVGSGVTNIVPDPFAYCKRLSSVYFKGNAPTFVGSGIIATAYYLPGTTGWGPTLGTNLYSQWPTVLWNPQAQNFGVGTNGFGFNVTGSSNLVIVVEAATNLGSPAWSPVSTNTLNTFVGTNGTSYFSDPQWTSYSSRFYRFRSP